MWLMGEGCMRLIDEQLAASIHCSSVLRRSPSHPRGWGTTTTIPQPGMRAGRYHEGKHYPLAALERVLAPEGALRRIHMYGSGRAFVSMYVCLSTPPPRV